MTLIDKKIPNLYVGFSLQDEFCVLKKASISVSCEKKRPQIKQRKRALKNVERWEKIKINKLKYDEVPLFFTNVK